MVRERQAEAAKHQRESLEQLHQAAVLSARVQLDPSDINRARLQTFLNLISQSAWPCSNACTAAARCESAKASPT
jgi:hypothetical protein